MMKRIKWTIICSALLLGFMLLYINLTSDDVLIRKGFKKYLFETSDVAISQVYYEDLIGLSIDGASFDFYIYEVEGLQESSFDGNYPRFDMIFAAYDLTDANFSFWKHTPIPKEEGLYHFDIAYSSNLSKNDLSYQFQKKDLLSKPGSYYSFINSYHVGVYLLVYSPTEGMLYVVSKKG